MKDCVEESGKRNKNLSTEGKSLRILVVTECFWPDIYAINDIVEKLVQRGHKVTVLTGLPDYTTTRIPEEYKHGRNRHQNYKGADVYRVPTIARRHGPIWRSLSYLSFVTDGWLRAKTQDWKHTEVWGNASDADFDVIYVWEVSPVTMAVPAIALKKRYKKPLFLYCMDIWPECVKAMSIKEGTLPYKMIHAWTKRIYKQCDHIAVSSKPFFQYMEEKNGIPRSKMSYLPQYADVGLLELDTRKYKPDEAWSAQNEETPVRSRDVQDSEISVRAGNVQDSEASGKIAHVDFLFIGNIGKAQNLDCLMKAMTVFKGRNDVTLHMVGGGSEFDNIKKMAEDLGLDDIVTFYGPKPFKEAISFYNKADACVLTLDGSTHIGDTLPGKLQTYMAAGKPILAAANGAAMEVIREANCGKCVAAGDYEAYGRILQEFVKEIQSEGQTGTKFAKEIQSEDQTGTKFAKEIQSKDQTCADLANSCSDISRYGDNARRYFRENFMEEQHFTELERLLGEMIK
ncbi:glycosyltransferase family 4 protein [Butyrivibrio sp. XBB1001]|uniref:glycosyltransferase family 4 protein n=1 Tax=Butyrivibrio sp. XBB1001 TaxID=1280682 RepID=UPI000421D392|nr:glycosyltransferase family 4 protein [Butyrivibrio sp. XBB1001]